MCRSQDSRTERCFRWQLGVYNAGPGVLHSGGGQGRGGGEGKGHRKTEKVLSAPALEAWNEK